MERPFEQVKLDLGHQGIGAVLVAAGGSYDWPAGGETHFGHRDVALLDTLDGWTVHVPGHADEAEALLRQAIAGNGGCTCGWTGRPTARPREVGDGQLQVLRRRPARRATVIAVGPMADRTLAATEGLDVTVLYAATVRPFDAGLARQPRRARGGAGRAVPGAARLLVRSAGCSPTSGTGCSALGVSRRELRRYGTVADHDQLHGLDVAGLRHSIAGFLQR